MKYSIHLLAMPLLLIGGCGNQDQDSSLAETEVASAAQVPPSALQAAAGDGPARIFYESRGWEASWSDQAAQELARALENRAAHGLDRVGFPETQSDSPAAREVALTEAALAYAGALARGATDPNEHYEIYTIPRPRVDLVAGLGQALDAGRLGAWLASLAPQDEEYRAISQAYQRSAAEAKEPRSPPIPESGLVHEGDRDARIPQIAEALARNGYLAGPSRAPSLRDSQQAPPPDDLYTSRLSEAVRRLQEDRGIVVDGVIGPNTIKAFNSGPADRARAAAVALERLRWLERDPPRERIDVNTAAATLEYVRHGSVVDRRKVIVGQPGWNTPQLQSPIYRLVANPTWTVPRSIQRAELGNASTSYLRSRNMVWRNGWIVQLPGPNNALGLVKFDMRNDYAIYLHDTPAKTLFERNVRQLSHGCVRVEDALGFAAMIAANWNVDENWEQARSSGKHSFVPVPDHIPVRLIYHPTYLAPSGEVRFAQDVYGWNGRIAERLGFGEGETPVVSPDVETLGP